MKTNRKEYLKLYRKNHKKEIRDYQKNWCKNNPEKVKKKKEKYDNKNRELINKKAREYRKNNPEKVKIVDKKFRTKHKNERAIYHKNYINKRRKTDNVFRLKHNLQIRTGKAFRNILNINKNLSTFKMIDLSPEQLKNYIENKFTSGMNWKNYGSNGWEIDHIIPLSSAKTEKNL